MPDVGYPLAQAVADLQQAGQLVGVWTAQGARFAPLGQGCWNEIRGKFRGAGLDSRHLEPRQLFVALPGDNTDGRQFIAPCLAQDRWAIAGLEAGWEGPETLAGIAATAGAGLLVCHHGQEALAVLAGCHRKRWHGTMVGVTGTNGKTTTKDFCSAMLSGAGAVGATRGNFNNKLGVPITLLNLSEQHDYAVVEMGASARGEIAYLAELAQPDIGVVTNASDAHLAEFGSLDGVIQGKGELIAALPGTGTAILNVDSPGYEQWAKLARCPLISFGFQRGDHRWDWQPGSRGWGLTTIDGTRWDTPLPGRHNGANLTAAWLAAHAAGVTRERAQQGLENFQGSPHRGRLLTWSGRQVLDDSYNANPRSMVMAGQSLIDLKTQGKTCAVLGAMAELGPDADRLHLETGKKLAALGVSVLVAVGPHAKSLGLGFDQAGGEAHYCADQEAAADWIKDHTAEGDAILLKGSRSSAMETVLTYFPDVEPVT